MPGLDVTVLVEDLAHADEFSSTVKRKIAPISFRRSPMPILLESRSFLSRFDVLHCTSVIPPYIFRPRKPQVVMTIHDVIALVTPEHVNRRLRLYYEHALPRIAARLDQILTDSRSAAVDITKYLRLPSERVSVVPLASRWPVLAPQDVTWAKESFLLAVGNVEPRKNLGRVIEAFRLVRSRSPGFSEKLVIAGKPGWGEDPRMSTTDDDIQWLGYVPDDQLRDLYRKAKGLVFPSLYEGFGLPLLEAMSQGCPAITSRLSSLPEVGGDAVSYVDAESSEDIAAAMTALIYDAERRERLIRKGLDQARTFGVDRLARDTFEVYRRMCSRYP
jgi:glycosyltransferase involved in cell wall biosynthesis